MQPKRRRPSRSRHPHGNTPKGSRTTEPRSSKEERKTAVATIVPEKPARIPDELVAEELANRVERSKVRGVDIEPSPSARMLDAILSTAVSHDTVCQYLGANAYRELGLDEAEVEHLDDSALNDYLGGVIQLCAILAPAATKRIPGIDVYSAALTDHGVIDDLKDEALREFLLPIFEESGIAERFEPLSGHLLYRNNA